jgi:hypothetical protein
MRLQKSPRLFVLSQAGQVRPGFTEPAGSHSAVLRYWHSTGRRQSTPARTPAVLSYHRMILPLVLGRVFLLQSRFEAYLTVIVIVPTEVSLPDVPVIVTM